MTKELACPKLQPPVSTRPRTFASRHNGVAARQATRHHRTYRTAQCARWATRWWACGTGPLQSTSPALPAVPRTPLRSQKARKNQPNAPGLGALYGAWLCGNRGRPVVTARI